MTSSLTVGKSTAVFHAKGYETLTSAAQYTVIWTESPQTSASRDSICWVSHRCQLSSDCVDFKNVCKKRQLSQGFTQQRSTFNFFFYFQNKNNVSFYVKPQGPFSFCEIRKKLL